MPEANMRAVIGSNTPDAIDYAKEESERLQRDYEALTIRADELETEAAELPEVLRDDDDKAKTVNLIKNVRDFTKRADGLRELEKQPHFRRGQGVDQFFFGIVDRMLRRDRKNREGLGDVLNRRLTEYDTRKLAEEQERRRKEFEEAERVRIAAEAKRRQEEEAAEQARLAAERARKPETTAAKTEVAQKADEAASVARVEETVATAQAETAYVDTLAKPADIMRTRTSAGTLATMKQETFAEIVEVAKLDGAKLWAFVSFENKEKALNNWAKSTDYREQMTGAKVGRRPKSTVR